MPRFATPVTRNDDVPVTQGIIFSGTPSQIVNLPTWFRAVIGVILVFVVTHYAGRFWAVPWYAPLTALIVIAAGVVIAWLQTACTEILIDTARITCRQGIFSRKVESLELFRIQDVTSLHPWWQRPFGIGTVVALTSDSNNPHWRLPGMHDAERLRESLNIAAIALRDAKGIREVNMGRI
jgi:membrane protein YdbS with pleckstrin-like domain